MKNQAEKHYPVRKAAETENQKAHLQTQLLLLKSMSFKDDWLAIDG